MAVIHSPHTKPLAGATVNWGHPLTTGLGFLAPANEGAGRILKNDLKPHGSPQNVDYGLQPGVSEWIGIDPWGPSYWVGFGGNASAGQGWSENTSSYTAIAVPNYTVGVCALFFDTASIGAAYQHFFSKIDTTNARFVFQRDQTDIRAGVVIASVGTYVTVAGFVETYKPYVFHLVVEQDTTTTYLSLYANGVLLGTNSVASLVPANASTIKICVASNNTRVAFGGGFYWMHAFNPDMVRIHASDPFAMYRDSHISRLSNSLAAAGSSFFSLGMGLNNTNNDVEYLDYLLKGA